jgi:S1-C subfamily serine protease
MAGTADAAGLRAGAMVIEVHGTRVAGSKGFVVAVRTSAPGDTVVLTLEGVEELAVAVEVRGRSP